MKKKTLLFWPFVLRHSEEVLSCGTHEVVVAELDAFFPLVKSIERKGNRRVVDMLTNTVALVHNLTNGFCASRATNICKMDCCYGRWKER